MEVKISMQMSMVILLRLNKEESRMIKINLMKSIFLFVIIFSLLTSCSYTSLNTKFSAKDAGFPISITQGFYDDNYQFVLKENYVVVKHFKIEYSQNAINSHSSPMNLDMSDTLTTLLNANDCDAIVNFQITRVNPARNRCCFQFVSWITWLPTFTLFSPVSVEFVVEGDLVRMLDGQVSYFNRNKGLFGVVFKGRDKIYLLKNEE